MTGKREKVQSLFLTALMVMSVFAGTVALSGTAAATTNDVVFNENAGTANDGRIHSQYTGRIADVTPENVNGNTDDVAVVLSTNGTYQSASDYDGKKANADSLVDVNVNGGTDISLGASNGLKPGVYTMYVNTTLSSYDPSPGAPDTDGVNLDNWANATLKNVIVANTSAEQSGDANWTNGNMIWQGQDVLVKGGSGETSTFSGSGASTVKTGTSMQTYLAEESGATWNVREADSVSGTAGLQQVGSSVRQVNLDDNAEALVSTSNLEGNYIIRDSNNYVASFNDSDAVPDMLSDQATFGSGVSIEVQVQDLSGEFNDSEIQADQAADVEFESNRGTFNVSVDSDGFSNDNLVSIFEGAQKADVDGDNENEVEFKVDGDQAVTADFSGMDTGDYTFDYSVVDTDATASSSITVEEATDASATVGDDGLVTVAEGDVAEIPIEISNDDTATVNLGYNEAGWAYNLTFDVEDGDSDGVVTPQLNLYKLGQGSPDTYISMKDSADSASDFNEDQITSGTLDPAAYDLNVTQKDAVTNEYGVGTLEITGDNVNGITSWTAPNDYWDEIKEDEKATIYDEVENKITEDDSTSMKDVQIWEIESTSVFGALEAKKGSGETYSDAFQQLNWSNDDFDFELEQQDPGPNKQAATVNLTDTNGGNNDGLKVVPDQKNSSLFVALDSSNTQTNGGNNVKADQEYEANFTIAKGSDMVDDVDSSDDVNGVSVTDVAELVEREIDFDTADDDVVRVKAATGQTISGDTSVAPGTELDLRIRSTGTSPFLLNPSATVQNDGTFSNEDIDFSDRSTNSTFEVSAKSISDSEQSGAIGDARTASVTFDDQELADGSVTVQSATLSDGGFVAIHQGSADGDVIGSSDLLDSGESTDVSVSLDADVEDGDTLVAMAHVDSNGDEAFNASDDDAYTNDNGTAITDSASITVVTETTEEETTEEETTEETTEEETTEETTEEMTEMTEETEETEETTTETGPGFTAVLSLVALVAAALLAVRRRD